jgi:hypothetical protein
VRRELLVPHQVLEQPDERHRRGHRLVAGALLHPGVRGVLGQLELPGLVPALRDGAAQRPAPLQHVLDALVVCAGVHVRRLVRVLLEDGVRDRHVEPVAELLEVVQGQLLHLVGGVASGEVAAQEVALDGVGEDDRRRPGKLGGRLVGRVDLVVVVPAAGELPDPVVRPVLDHLRGPRVPAEEVLPDVGAVVGLERLVVAVGRGVHHVQQGAVPVGGEQRVPAAAPDDLDHVPAGATEEALQLLHDLAVAPHRSVQPLQVAVDHEGEVVQLLVGGGLQRAAALHLVHLAVAEERPDALLGGVLQATVVQVLVELGLPDRRDRAQAHRHGRELPEVGHLARVRVGRERADPAVDDVALLLAEAVQVVLAEPALEEGTGVHAGAGVALEEHLVAAAGVVLAAEEVVEAHLVERRRRRVGRDVTADADARALCAVHHDRRVPAGQPTELALQVDVAGVPRLTLGGDRVDVVGGGQRRQPEVLVAGPFEQPQHDVAGPVATVRVDHHVDRVEPLRGFLGVDVRQIGRQSVQDRTDRIARCHSCALPFSTQDRCASLTLPVPASLVATGVTEVVRPGSRPAAPAAARC